MRRCLLALLAVALAVPAAASAQDQPPSLPVNGTPADLNAPPPEGPNGPRRDTEPVVLRGSDLPAWSARANQTARLPLIDLACHYEQLPDEFPRPPGHEPCPHNNYAEPHANTADVQPDGTVPTDRLLGYRWDAGKGAWQQIPFQVDEVFARYLNNSKSGFALYSGEDQHTTYAYDREGFRYTADGPASDPCRARPASDPAVDPIAGLDDNDELAFMYSDAGDQVPPGTQLPAGMASYYEVLVSDPADATAPPRYVYVMHANADGPKPAFDASNGYVSYKRDADADLYEFSQSSYRDYGNAAPGVHCDKDGKVVRNADGTPKVERRRPRDYATIKTDRYRFRYDGRWLMTEINISSNGGRSYGPDVVDRWKARAFAQDAGSETPCCGYEEEDTNWGGSSTLLGERVGPVRAIRETWGADSGTNVIRRESFYRYEMRQKTWLRVHVIPPLDGIYAQWDFNAGRMTKFFNSGSPDDGFDIDGRNDETFGNFDDPCNSNWEANERSAIDEGYRDLYQSLPLCENPAECPEEFEEGADQFPDNPAGNPASDACGDPYHQSVDAFDPTMSKANTALEWSQTSGPYGTIVDRITADVRDLTPGGAAQSLVATPYYRDDSCFDDGTGTDPGPKVKLRSGDEPRETKDGQPRKCWEPSDGEPNSAERFFQGSIGTHGLHLLFLVESDNARQTVPVNEIVSEWRMAMLPGDASEPDPGTGAGGGSQTGQQYSEAFDQPVQPNPQTSQNIVDRTKPRVKLKVKRVRKRLVRLDWSATDSGGSGLKAVTLQVKRGKKWRTLSTSVKRRRMHLRIGKGRYVFRVRAQDRAGNRSAWLTRR